MEKRELLKKMIADICNNECYDGAVFYGDDDDYFAFHEGNLHVLEGEDLSYFSVHFTPEEKQEVDRIANELKLDPLTFLAIRGGIVDCLQSLIECYEEYDGDEEEEVENKIGEIEKLMAVFEDESSIFYHRESKFLDLYLFPEIKISGAPYVLCDWDHDDAYYYDLPISTGVCDLLYDVVVGMDSYIALDRELDYIENDCDLTAEEKEEAYDHWIEILSEIGNRIV